MRLFIKVSEIILLILLILVFFSVSILSLVPPVSRDALVHHLAIPKLYLKYGGIFEIPTMDFSYFPMNLDFLYLISLYFGNDIAPKYIHFSFAIMTAAMIYWYLRKRIGSIAGLFGAVFFLSIPVIIKLSITVYVDLGLIFFSTTSLLLIFNWVESGFRMKFLILSAIACGLALGTKYNGLVVFLLITLFTMFIYSRFKPGEPYITCKSIKQGIIFIVIALVFFSPWMIRNWYWTRNPVFPLYNTFFNPPEVVNMQNQISDNDSTGSITYFSYRSMAYNEKWWDVALIPVRMFFSGDDNDLSRFDGKMNPFLLILPFFAFIRDKKKKFMYSYEKKILVFYVLLYFAIAFFSTVSRVRYMSPVIPPLVILSVYGLNNIVRMVRDYGNHYIHRVGFAGIAIIITLMLSYNISYIIQQFKYVEPVPLLREEITRDEYIAKYRFEYPAMKFINENLPLDSKLMFIYLGRRGYYCDREYYPDSGGNTIMLHTAFKNDDKDPAKEIWFELRRRGLTHLVINTSLFEKQVYNIFNENERNILQVFFNKYLSLLYSHRGVSVFVLKSAGDDALL